MKNENYRYIKYIAYGKLRKELICRCKCLNVKRTTIAKIKSLLTIVYTELKDAIENPIIEQNDEIQIMVDKKKEIENNETYSLMLNEAYEAYKIKFISMDRPTITQIEKQTQKVLDSVIQELLILY